MFIIAGGILIPVCIVALFWFGLVLLEMGMREDVLLGKNESAQAFGVVMMLAAVGAAGFVIAYPILWAAPVS